VAELKKLLIALIKGKGSFEQANEAVQQFLARSPDKAPLVAKLLRAARDAGLAHPMYVSLSSHVTSHIVTERDPEATVLALDDGVKGFDRTRLALNAPNSDTYQTLRIESRDLAKLMHGGTKSTNKKARPLTVSNRTTEIVAPNGEVSDEATLMQSGLEYNPASVNPDLGLGEALDERQNGHVYTDTTELNPASDEATSSNADGTDKTIALAAEGDFDAFSDEALASADETADPDTGASWPTIHEQRRPGLSSAFREGDHLRNRFQLVSKLGEGGMGAVWKGKDLLKEEARDRNPFVAIKLLQGNFKEHPEAFIALQRETAKQQRLAHPNIATVFDFDRDDSSNTVFMTMEVLEGQPLDSFIRKLPDGGLAVEEAMPLIEQLCNGLAYAHSHGLVHADLKPGNCFYTKDGTIKLLDFGIARATNTKADTEGETTLFDPSELGALTPTYATVEMFEGVDPDPRDDVYALAIMTYQLLTGKHPYGKKAAPKARELGLKPEPVGKLNTRQNRALMRGLSFEREERTPTVEEFFESVRPKKSRAPVIIAASLVATLIAGAGAYSPMLDLINQYRREQIISIIEQSGIVNIRKGLDQANGLGDPKQLNLILEDQRTKNSLVAHIEDGDEQKISEMLSLIAPYDLDWQRELKEVERVKSAIMSVFDTKIREAFNVEEARYDFAAASALILELDRLYPDTAEVLERGTLLNQEKALKLAELNDDYTRYLGEGRLLPEQNGREIGDIIEVVRQIDPQHPLLTDQRLRFRYGELAEAAIDRQDYRHADALLRAGLGYAADDSKLRDLRFRLESDLKRIASQRRVAEIEQRIRPRFASLDGLPDFLEIQDDLIVLEALSPESMLLAEVQEKLRGLFQNQMRISTTRRNWAEGERVLMQYSKLFDIPYLLKQRQLLSRIEEQADHTLQLTPERQAAVDQRIETISRLLATPEFSSDWEIKLKLPYKELLALLPEGDPALQQVRNQTARLYLQNAKSAFDSERFIEALAFVERGRAYHPELRNFEDFERAILIAQKKWRRQREEEQRLARIEALKNGFVAAAERNDVRDADAKLAGIRAEGVPEDDPFLARDAPIELANAYIRLARSRIEEGAPDFEQALTLATRGLELAPGFEGLRLAVASYESEVKKRQLEVSLHRLFDGSSEIDVVATRSKLRQLEADFPKRYPELSKEFAEIRGNRIRELAKSKDLRITSLHQRMDEFRALFPLEAQALHESLASIVEERIRATRILNARDLESLSGPLSEFRAFSPSGYASLSRDLSNQLAGRIRSLEKTDKLAAASLLEASIRHFGDSSFRGIEIEPPAKEISDGMKLVAAGRLNAARSSLEAARNKDPTQTDLLAFERILKSSMEKANGEYQRYAEAAKRSRSTQDQSKFDKDYDSIQQLWSDNPEFRRIQIAPPRRGHCSKDLAGYGRRRGGECWDLIGRARGPRMVVIPSGGIIRTPFAISKYEISGSDFSDYCKSTGRCRSLSTIQATLPLTSISAKEAEEYARWLSEGASKTAGHKIVYRLPTEEEWEHAANAAGAPLARKYNCRVTAAGSVISGYALVDAASGEDNGWGLANHVGNAQEWVRTAAGLKARGGSYQDPISRCDVSISRSHSGQPDGITGFRLVREMGKIFAKRDRAP
jgi:serine/threonine protein kinase